jgi:hypothetical protein
MARGELAWIAAGDGYEIALNGARVVARSPKGAVLKALPAALKDAPAVQQLRELRDWLARHERECASTVETWMVRSLPVPVSALAAVWPDPAWQTPLRDAVLVALGPDGQPQRELAGFLRHVERERGVGLVTLDGETTWSAASLVAIPHPILLPELDDFRDFATELQVEQGIGQLYRETWAKPDDLSLEASAVTTFNGGRFQQLMHALGRARDLGYLISGGFAVARVWEGGRLLEARHWIGSDAPESEAWTGDLSWIDTGAAQQAALAVREVGPVAFSEGMRMASAVYAGRLADTDAN